MQSQSSQPADTRLAENTRLVATGKLASPQLNRDPTHTYTYTHTLTGRTCFLYTHDSGITSYLVLVDRGVDVIDNDGTHSQCMPPVGWRVFGCSKAGWSCKQGACCPRYPFFYPLALPNHPREDASPAFSSSPTVPRKITGRTLTRRELLRSIKRNPRRATLAYRHASREPATR